MGTKTITQLPSADALQGNELFETVQVSGGFPTSVKTQARNITSSPSRYTEYEDADDPQYPEHPWQEGIMQWDRVNHTLQIMNEISDMRLQVGQETVVRVKNETGQTIPNGSVCYFSGVCPECGLSTVDLARADSSHTLISPSVATHDIPDNTEGYCTKRGFVNNVDTSHVLAGLPLFCSPTSAGEFQNERPVTPDRICIVGVTTISHPTSGTIWVEPAQLSDQLKISSYTLPLDAVVDSVVPLTGTFDTIGTSATGDITADWVVGNNHAFIRVNQLTTGGDIVITGDSVSEQTGVIVTGDTETITVDPSATRPAVSQSQHYQTTKKWWVVTNIDVSTGTIVGINYNYGAVGYPDQGNRDFRLLGYRLELYSSGNNPDVRFRLLKVQDDGQKRMQILPIDDIGIDADAGGDQIIDHVRTGADDRSYNSPVTNLWPDNRMIVFKQTDFYDYWNTVDSDRPNIQGADNDEGYIIRIEGEPEGGGITNVDYLVLKLYYELL